MAKLKKKYLFLFVIIIIGIIVGIIFSNILNSEDNKLVVNKVSKFFNNLRDDVKIDFLKTLFISIKNNLIYLLVIWILGLSVIGLFLNNFILFFKSFVLGFSIGAIINIYLYGGIILSFLYVFPSFILNLLVFLVMVYYANDFSLKLFNLIFRKSECNFALLLKKYIKIFLYLAIILIISSIMETFITPYLIKLFSFLIK